MAQPTADEIRTAVQDRYATAARAVTSGGPAPAAESEAAAEFTRSLYAEELDELPVAAVAASLGCGNPTALAQLRPGQVVLDLGSGGGIDVLLSARRVGPEGRAYGLDMTEEMLELARRNQREAGVTNAEFLHGTIEHVPLPDASVDVIISNCVINLAADKDVVLREALRVLKPGGRLAISDIVLLRPLPEQASQLMALWTGCVAGALTEEVYRTKLLNAGFANVEIQSTQVFDRTAVKATVDNLDASTPLPAGVDVDAVVDALDGAVMSAFVRGRRPVS